ncbi:recombinase family protein [Gracilibacillus marinus]|uniref:Recombinase family protein n=1 Tax=Gracilibacillus marinus TaxID=630535 RepID=A0ABV8VW68_9BACI
MLVGYARISTQDQSLDLQKDALLQIGCKKVFTDVASGGKASRTGLEDALNFLRKEDTLVVWKLDRLGRSLKHLIDLVNDLNERGIHFKSLQESIDTSTSGGKLVFHVFGALAEFEREIIKERTKAGLSAAKARGRLGGRPKIMDEKKVAMAKKLREDPNHSIEDICQILGVSRATFYRYLKAGENTNAI